MDLKDNLEPFDGVILYEQVAIDNNKRGLRSIKPLSTASDYSAL